MKEKPVYFQLMNVCFENSNKWYPILFTDYTVKDIMCKH